ncbi:MAG: alpha-hydroxy-acid oxidizing protein [Faecousia sp.]
MSGNSDELVRTYLDRYCIEYRMLETQQATTECTLFGQKLATPILLGGLAHYHKLQPGGSPEYAKAAAAMHTAMWTGYCDDADLEKVIAVGAPAARIFKPFADRDITLRAIQHDKAAGACAIAMDVDHAYNKLGLYDEFFEKPLAPQTRESLEEYVRASDLPFYVKGILSVRDAEICAEAGVAGIVISQHQNMFPWAVPPVKVLPEIRKAVGGKMTILVDSGMRDGYDVFKALAWGADGVFTVRPMMPIFREQGWEGVAKRLETMTNELRICLSRTGAKDISHIDPEVIRQL